MSKSSSRSSKRYFNVAFRNENERRGKEIEKKMKSKRHKIKFIEDTLKQVDDTTLISKEDKQIVSKSDKNKKDINKNCSSTHEKTILSENDNTFLTRADEKDSETLKTKKKKKKDKERKYTEGFSVNESNDSSEKKKKKRKKDKDDKVHEDSLGVVDQAMLSQTGNRLGLPVSDSDLPKTPKEAKKPEVKKDDMSEAKNSDDKKNKAIQYLHLWKKDRQSWKFNKMLQIKLLNVMYDDQSMDADNFEILLEYLENIVGKSKDTTIKMAESIVKSDENEETTSPSLKVTRASKILKMLS